jgi:hypothetical protein
MTAVEYVEASGIPESRWPNFKEWFSWYERNNLVGVVKDGEEVVGVAVARAIDGLQEPAHYVHIPNGDTAFVDLTVTSIDGKSTARSRLAMKRLLSILWDELGPRRSLIFNRNGTRKTYDYMKFMRKALL